MNFLASTQAHLHALRMLPALSHPISESNNHILSTFYQTLGSSSVSWAVNVKSIVWVRSHDLGFLCAEGCLEVH